MVASLPCLRLISQVRSVPVCCVGRGGDVTWGVSMQADEQPAAHPSIRPLPRSTHTTHHRPPASRALPLACCACLLRSYVCTRQRGKAGDEAGLSSSSSHQRTRCCSRCSLLLPSQPRAQPAACLLACVVVIVMGWVRNRPCDGVALPWHRQEHDWDGSFAGSLTRSPLGMHEPAHTPRSRACQQWHRHPS